MEMTSQTEPLLRDGNKPASESDISNGEIFCIHACCILHGR